MRKAYELLVVLVLLAVAGSVQAQETAPASSPAGDESKSAEAVSPPPIPAEQIIQKFAAKEEAFKQARGNYTYKQYVRVQDFTPYGAPGGEYIRKSEIVFTPEGERYEHVTYEPPSTLKQISITPQDQKDLIDIQPFVLTTEDLPKYNVEYRGRERVDEIGTYVFQVSPKVIEKNQRYFQGTIWVDDQDLQIVKTRGKAVPDLHSSAGEDLFPEFDTYREPIDGRYWFPTYTHADDILHFSSGDVRVRLTIRYTDYKQYRVTTKIRGSGTVEPEGKKPPKDQPK